MSDIKEVLSKYKSIAMVGVSNDPTKASTIVMKYMQKYGFKVYPVNPRAEGQKILGEEVFAKISEQRAATAIGLPLIEPELSIRRLTIVSLNSTSLSIL